MTAHPPCSCRTLQRVLVTTVVAALSAALLLGEDGTEHFAIDADPAVALPQAPAAPFDAGLDWSGVPLAPADAGQSVAAYER